jgi:hypothetical protein
MVERRKEEALREEERSWKYPPRVLYSRYKQNKVFLLYMLLPLLMLLRRWMLLQRREDFAISSRFSPLRSWQKGNNTGPPLFSSSSSFSSLSDGVYLSGSKAKHTQIRQTKVQLDIYNYTLQSN